jgi:uncharacterized small protein (DUF1192 family)
MSDEYKIDESYGDGSWMVRHKMDTREQQIAALQAELERVKDYNKRLCSASWEPKNQADLEKEIADLRAELARTKLQWQTGNINRDGWYWVKESSVFHDIWPRYMHALCPVPDGIKWAGPLTPPAPEKDKQSDGRESDITGDAFPNT